VTLDRRTFLQIAAAGLGAAAIPLQIHAKAPLQGRQVPGFYRFEIGDFEVTALNDGAIEIDPALYPEADPAQARELLQAAHRAPKAPTSVNAYAVNTGNALVLVDTGGAKGLARHSAGYRVIWRPQRSIPRRWMWCSSLISIPITPMA
jgi:hypothetical protein